MKLYTTPTKRPVHQGAFTLIEMIGVLAVIAILAAMLIPKVFQAINNARVNNAAVSCETVKTATADHYGKYGKLDQIWGTNSVTWSGNLCPGYDTNLLMVEGLLDKPFFVKIAGGDPSANSILELTQKGAENAGQGYFLDGSTNNSTANAQFVLEAVIKQVAISDAKDLNDLVDGTALGASSLSTGDTKGRVEYVPPTNGTTTVYVYLTHR